MNVGSLFTGIGGFDLGLERAGMRVVWQCEANEYRRKVLALRFPGVPCLPDVRELDPGALEPVDLVCGGFPCVDISNAGKRAGIDGPGSRLWTEMFRVVRALRPRYVVVENVAALLRRGGGRVLGDLASIGYDAEWDCLRAADLGAPHLRDRVWIVAYPRRESSGGSRAGLDRARRGANASPSGPNVADSNGFGRSPGWDDAGQQEVPKPVDRGSSSLADTEVQPIRTGLRQREPGGQWGRRLGDERCARHPWTTEPDVGRVAHGVPARVDRLAALGDALVPQIAEWIGRRLMEAS